ncbi:MAG: bile acid:sodium symporter, partial [Leptospiraceae bacterium]|nr:bile acid:sodium symporter [Leptospiraceae bacterium]
MIHSVLRRCLLSDLKTPAHSRRYLRRLAALLLVAVSMPLAAQELPVQQGESQETVTRSPEEVYQSLMAMTGDEQAVAAFDAIKAAGRELNPEEAHELEFTGNLRFLPARPAQTEADPEGLYLIRSLAGEIYIVLTPEDTPDLDTSAYADLQDKIKNKMIFQVAVNDTIVDGVVYHYVRLTAPPQREPLDAAFFYFIVAMLFLVMLGMGMTLRPRDFSMIVLKPRGMLVGPICQFGLLPALAALLGTLVGYREEFPFMFVGLILITSSPGGVTSNLMTYWAKGDLALSVSMTAISTVLSLVMAPFLLGVYADGIPGV